ncbi:unnamed protein product, partial [Rotaria socialis]
MGTDDKHWAKE